MKNPLFNPKTMTATINLDLTDLREKLENIESLADKAAEEEAQKEADIIWLKELGLSRSECFIILAALDSYCCDADDNVVTAVCESIMRKIDRITNKESRDGRKESMNASNPPEWPQL